MPNLNEVAFEMIGDDYNKTRDQLNSIRARKTKFVNDDMKNPDPVLVAMLQNFYLSFFPKQSQFERRRTSSPLPLPRRVAGGALVAKLNHLLLAFLLVLLLPSLTGITKPSKREERGV